MSRRIVITHSAENDLCGIWDYIARRGSADAADKVQREFEAAFQKLAEMPGLGHYRQDVRHYRFWRVYSYLIAYRFSSDRLTVYRVVSGHRNLRRLFQEPEM
jgi:plasmid stabilization system protein ParE